MNLLKTHPVKKLQILSYLIFITVSAICCCVACSCFSNHSLGADSTRFCTQRIIVKFNEKAVQQYTRFSKNISEIPPLDLLRLHYGLTQSRPARRTAGEENRMLWDPYSRIFILEFSSLFPDSVIAAAYSATGLFEYTEPDYRFTAKGILSTTYTPNDSLYYNRQWALYNDGTFSLSPSKNDADIDMDLAWETTRGDSSVIVAVFDSGLRMDHPEFSGRIWNNFSEIPGNGADDDLNGYKDDIAGWDFVNDDNDPTDDDGHGTFIAGVIGANGNNGIGYAGVDWHCKIMVCKVIDTSGAGQYSWIGEAVFYAVEKGARVINLSLGGTNYSDYLRDVMTYAYNNHVVCITAMGNEDTGASEYPANFQSTIAVGATDPDDRRSRPFVGQTGTGSNYGNHIDIVAPGNYIYGISHTSLNNYNVYAGGTSIATAYVSGVSAMLIALDPSRTPAQIRQTLQSTADDQVGETGIDVAGFDIYYGYGRLNADMALKYPLNSAASIIEDDIRIFPNPASGKFRLSFVLTQSSDADIALINSRGQVAKVIASTILNKSVYTIPVDMGEHGSGLYIIRFNIGGATFLKKCVILP